MTEVLRDETGAAVGQSGDAPRHAVEEAQRWLASIHSSNPGCKFSEQSVPLSGEPAAAMSEADPSAGSGEPDAPWRDRELARHQFVRNSSEVSQVDRSGAVRCCASKNAVHDADRFTTVPPRNGADDQCEDAECDRRDRLVESSSDDAPDQPERRLGEPPDSTRTRGFEGSLGGWRGCCHHDHGIDPRCRHWRVL